jgi:hypothetical protein
MSPIEEHLIATTRRELVARGIPDAEVAVLSSEAENWRLRVRVAHRSFEIGFNHRDRVWCTEMTAGQERHFVSNDGPKIGTSAAARQHALDLLRRAVADPQWVVRDPPIL